MWWFGPELGGMAKLMFGLAFRSGYTWMFQAAGSQEAPKASADCSVEPQIRERGEVCAVIPSWRPQDGRLFW
jgi:hypothetical protein